MRWRDYFNATTFSVICIYLGNSTPKIVVAFIVIYLFKEKHVHDVRNMLVKRNCRILVRTIPCLSPKLAYEIPY